MDGDGGMRCAVLARALDEPLAGTAPVAAAWFCLEARGAWPRAVEEHPDPVVRDLAARAAAVGWRMLLMRRPGRRDDNTPSRVILADTRPTALRLSTFTVDSHAELADIAMPGLGGALPGTPMAVPPLMICTHGRRDRCCALEGRALAQAVVDAGEPEVWECSHLGGHRFAPAALVLPTGYSYGRIDASAAIALRKSAALGEVDVAHCRGRSTWSVEGQVAELAVRTATGLRDASELVVTAGPGSELRVTARNGRRWAVDVTAAPGPLRPASCGAEVTRSVPLHASAVRRIT